MSIVSLLVDQNTLGISIYIARQNLISCSQFAIIQNDRKEIVLILVNLDDIESLLVPQNMNCKLLQYIRDEYLAFKGIALCVQKVMSCEFTYDSSINKLLEIDFTDFIEDQMTAVTSKIGQLESTLQENNLKNKIRQPKYEILSQKLDLEKKTMVKSLGGLLCNLINSQRIDRKFNIQNIIFLKNMNGFVHYNEQTLSYLSIFKDDIHPSMIKGKGQTKEGFSLFMLFSKFIFTKQGLSKLKHLFLKPTFNLEILMVIYLIQYEHII